ncbi:MAG: DUF4347 domain-containing protein [Nitrospirales bacterium]|nr:DUF4347 domain-containing protein [Nitrospirales bacterium]
MIHILDPLRLPGLSFSAPPDPFELGGINPAAELILLDSHRDGIEQIVEALKGRTDTEAIHLISHGHQALPLLETGHLTVD